MRLRDDNGTWVGSGDTIEFSYGIPPVPVVARVVSRGKQLFALTPGHNPPSVNLRSLRQHVGGWYKA